MKRRDFLKAGAATAAFTMAPNIVRAAGATTLKFVPYADLALLDPLAAAFVTRNHVMMVFDTLYALDAEGQPQPQMAEGHTVDADGKIWRISLRDGLKFHDGSPVLARDVVASLKRWATADAFGQALMGATDELSAPSDNVVEFKLKRPFPLLLHAVAKPTNLVAAIMPERLASLPTTPRLTEMVGSGPFQFVANERVPGARNVYRKFDGYVPRPNGTPSFCAGPRIANFDQIEWLTMPDSATQASALSGGEVDWVEQPLMDLIPSLRANKQVRLKVVEDKGLVGVIRFNQLIAPFDNPAIRRAVLKAVNQREFMQSVVGDNAELNASFGFFTPNSEAASDAGMDGLSGKHELATLKEEVKAAGYKGEKVVCLTATDVPRINAICSLTSEVLKRLGFNVDEVATDWGTVVQRSTNRQPTDKGGWNVFAAFFSGYDMMNPAGHLALRSAGTNSWNGWPTSAKIERLRQDWLEAADVGGRKKIATELQLQAFQDVPYIPLGAYLQPSAFRSNLDGALTGIPLFTNIRRT